jgi:hypothetical protein
VLCTCALVLRRVLPGYQCFAIRHMVRSVGVHAGECAGSVAWLLGVTLVKIGLAGSETVQKFPLFFRCFFHLKQLSNLKV